MLVLNAKIHLIIFSLIIYVLLIKTVLTIWHSCDIHAYKLNEDVYMIEKVKTNLPQSKTNNPPYYICIEC